MRNEILCGDARELARTLPDESVSMIVTSPPYFGLRSYLPDGHEDKGKEIGSEQTPQEYVAGMVDLFRELRRALHPTGTLFLNLGDSYWGSGMQSSNPGGKTPKQMTNQGSYSVGASRERSYGNSDIESEDYSSHGYFSQSLYDERTDSWWNHIADNDGGLALKQAHESLVQILAYIESNRLLSSSDLLDQRQQARFSSAIRDLVHSAIPAFEQLRDVLASTTCESFPPLQGFPKPVDGIWACLSSLRSFSSYVHQYVHKLDEPSETLHCNPGTVLLSEELVDHIRCIYGYCSLVFSWLNPPKVQPQYTTGTLKPKDLIGIPWRVALALQADEWYLRSDIIWHKKSPMPESVTDRPTKAHEYLFLLSKSPQYFYDADAIRENFADERMGNPGKYAWKYGDGAHGHRQANGLTEWSRGAELGGRNKRSVWTLGPEPYPAAHFATFPRSLVRPCILAGTSAYGNCAACGSPYVRVVERTGEWRAQHDRPAKHNGEVYRTNPGGGLKGPNTTTEAQFVGWQASCTCDADVVPAIVLDPFMGSGTTAAVCVETGRDWLGFELNEDYVQLAMERIYGAQPALFSQGIA